MYTIPYETMHRRLMHVHAEKVLKACADNGIKVSKSDALQHHCEACHLGKSTQIVSREPLVRPLRPLSHFHFDVIEQKPLSIRHHRYTLHFVDPFSDYHWIFFVKKKDEIHGRLKAFIQRMEVQSGGLQVQQVHMDNGREFALVQLNELALEKGFAVVTTAANTPYQNGKIERSGRTIVTNARTALISCGLPEFLWPYAEETVVRILNLLPDDSNPGNLSPHQTLYQALGLQKKL